MGQLPAVEFMGVAASLAGVLAVAWVAWRLARRRRTAPRRSSVAAAAAQDSLNASVYSGLPATVLVLALDGAGRIRHASARASAAMGLARPGESLQGKSFVGLSCWDEPAQARHALSRALLKAEMGRPQKLALGFLIDDRTVQLVFEMQPWVGTGGELRSVMVTAIDVGALQPLASPMAQLRTATPEPNAFASVGQATPLNPVTAAARATVEAMLKLLPAARTQEDALKIVSAHLARLFPGSSGALFMRKQGHSGLHNLRAWGVRPDAMSRIGEEDCWSLRHRELHWVDDPEVDVSCAHHPEGRCACVPLVAQGELSGVLTVSWGETAPERAVLAAMADPLAAALAQTMVNIALREQASRDPLTGLLNRQTLDAEFARLVRRAQEDGQHASILMIDIDHFKAFNDQFGHDAGDLVLKSVAVRISQIIRASDLAFRYGGEELVVLLPACGEDEAIASAKRIQAGLADLTLVSRGERLPPVTVSVGVSCFPNDGSSVASLFQVADAGVYAAKSAGRNAVVHALPAARAA